VSLGWGGGGVGSITLWGRNVHSNGASWDVLIRPAEGGMVAILLVGPSRERWPVWECLPACAYLSRPEVPDTNAGGQEKKKSGEHAT